MMHAVWNRKIPTYVGVLLLFLLLGITVLLTRGSRLINIRAVPSNVPAFVRITNISSNSFTVSYTTSAPNTGSLSYGETSEVGQVVPDDRDKLTGTVTESRTHYFIVSSLKPSTTYYFTLLSGNDTFKDNGSPYSVKTASVLPATAENKKTIAGKILLPDGTAPKEALAYAQVGISQLLSLPIKSDGTYSFNLNNLLSQNLGQYAVLADTDTVNLTFIGDGRQATATMLLKDAASVPVVTLSQAYTFTAETPLTPTIAESIQPTIPQFSSQTVSDKLEILVPQQNQGFNDSQPELSGTALPGGSLDISIQAIIEIKDTITTDASGRWKYRPKEKLEPGVYTLIVSGKERNGRVQTVSESFVVYAEGSQFTEPSVAPTKPAPSATPLPTALPSVFPSSTPVASVTAIPSPTLFVPSPTFIPTATLIPTVATPSQALSPQPSLAPGSNEVFVSIGLITFATIVSALLFFLIRV